LAHNRGVNLPVNAVDLVVLCLAAFLAFAGWRSGAIPQVLGLAGALAGIAVVILLAPAAVGTLADLDPPARAFIALAGAFIVVAVAEAVGASIGGAIRDRLRPGVLGRLDQALGAVFGVLQALLLAWLIGGLLAVGPVPALAKEAQRSAAVRSLLETLPPPGEVAADITGLIDASGLPAVFSGLEPFPATPVETPTQKAANQVAKPARGSVVRVDTVACGRGFTGTAFSVARGYFVTNAHVVAGAKKITLTPDGEEPVKATVVLFDPKLDLAVVRATGLKLPALELADETPERGTIGATLGYSGGEQLTVDPAAVSALITAVGRDLYGKTEVERAVVQLQSPVDPGDSGGPFVLEDGRVGAVVFAESRTDDSVGYALSPTAVAKRIAPALTRTMAVSTGSCLR
jgi:S1-C subfamily serine protease